MFETKIENLCELLILESWNNRDSEFKALCSFYFDIKYVLGCKNVYEFMKAIILGYIGEHKDYSQKAQEIINKIQISDKWDERIIALLTIAIFKLITNNVSDAIDIVNQLRKEQGQFEEQFLNQSKGNGNELVVLYYMAKIIEMIGQHLNKNKNDDYIEYKIQLYTDKAKKFANISPGYEIELLLRYFETFVLKFIKETCKNKTIEYLHIWGQSCWHDPVIIIGNTGSLKRLKHAIESAIKNGEHKVPAFFTSDREGFSLYVICKDDNKWDNRAVPYFDEMATEKNPNAIYPAEEIKNK